MAKISIPDEVREGFALISEMKTSDVNTLAEILSGIDAGEKMDDVLERLSEVFESKSRILLQTIVSFSGLLEKDDATASEVAENLTESFFENSKKSNESIEVLQNNLNIILSNVGSLLKNINSRRSTFDNESILRSSKLITDLRILFQDDLSDKNRDAIILHKLHVQYEHNFNDKELYFTLDVKDLNRLKSEIEKAIEKDHLRKTFYVIILHKNIPFMVR